MTSWAMSFLLCSVSLASVSCPRSSQSVSTSSGSADGQRECPFFLIRLAQFVGLFLDIFPHIFRNNGHKKAI